MVSSHSYLGDKPTSGSVARGGGGGGGGHAPPMCG